MWVLKLRIVNNENVLNRLASKYNVILYGYPLNSFVRDGKFYVTAGGKLVGEEKDIRFFLNA